MAIKTKKFAVLHGGNGDYVNAPPYTTRGVDEDGLFADKQTAIKYMHTMLLDPRNEARVVEVTPGVSDGTVIARRTFGERDARAWGLPWPLKQAEVV